MSNILIYLANEKGFYSHLNYDPTKNSLKIDIDTRYHEGFDGHIKSWNCEEIDTLNKAIQEGLSVEINITRTAFIHIKKMFKHKTAPSTYNEKCILDDFKESINQAIRFDSEYGSRISLAGGPPPPKKGMIFTQKILDSLVRSHSV